MGENCAFQNLSSFTLSPDFPDPKQQSGFYTDWQFNWNHTTPDAIITSVNLEEQNSQLVQYPRFRINSEYIQSPSSFTTPIQLLSLTSNQAVFQFRLKPHLLCKCEVLITSTRQSIQKYSFSNLGNETQTIALEWFIFLKGKKHQSLTPWTKNRNTGLYLKINHLHILSSITGPTKVGQHSIPSLIQHTQLEANDTGSFFIISNYADTQEDCENQILSVNIHNWDALFTRADLMYKASQIKITCENEDWNTVLDYSQIQATRLFSSIPVTAKEITAAQASATHSSIPHNQFTDNQNNTGFTIFTIYHLWHVFGAANAARFRKILDWVFDQQRIDGQIYWSLPEPIPSLKGNAMPVLANLVWQIYENNENIDWLSRVYPKLKKFLLSWFSEFNDKDQDGCPEWRNAHQIGFSETMLSQQHPVVLHPYFFRQFEHPGLLSLLIEDFHSLENIAKELNLPDEQLLWQERAAILSQHLQKFLVKEQSTFQVLDYFTHQNPEVIHIADGNGEVHNEENFALPNNHRIRIDIILDGAFTRPVQLKLQGKSGSITIKETINFSNMIWVENQVTAISQYTYTAIEQVIIEGINDEESWQINGLYFDYHDISMLLPHIAGISALASQPAYKLHTGSYGLSLLATQENTPSISSMPWNAIILEKLLKNNDLSSAMEMISMILNGSSYQFVQKNGLFEYYDSNSASGYGIINHIHGLIPQALLLNVLGIKKMTAEGIYITHFNPFSISFTVQYKGMKLKLFSDSVEIQFRGFVSRITQTGYHRIRLTTDVAKQI